MGTNVKPLTHWAIYKGYRLRITRREAGHVEGLLGMPEGTCPFRYDATQRTIVVQGGPGARESVVRINEYGWETGAESGTEGVGA